MAILQSAGLDSLVGSLAAVMTTVAFIPQAWMTWKTRRADGVSLAAYSLFTAGVGMWFLYGLMLGAWPVIISNFLTLVLALFILGMKVRFG